MSKLEELKALVADSFKDAMSKEQIEAVAKINAKLEEAQTEQKELLDKNKELLDSYREVILHTSVKPNSNIAAADDTSAFKSFEEQLSDFMKAKK